MSNYKRLEKGKKFNFSEINNILKEPENIILINYLYGYDLKKINKKYHNRVLIVPIHCEKDIMDNMLKHTDVYDNPNLMCFLYDDYSDDEYRLQQIELVETTIDFYMSLPYTREIVREDTNCYFIKIKELEGCVSVGTSLKDAWVMIDDAMRAWLEVALSDGMIIPLPE